jgi:hypothetical protein
MACISTAPFLDQPRTTSACVVVRTCAPLQMVSRQTTFHDNTQSPGDNNRQGSPGDQYRQGVDACGPTKPLPDGVHAGVHARCKRLQVGPWLCRADTNSTQLNDRNRTDHRYQHERTHSGPGWPSTGCLQGLLHSSAPHACPNSIPTAPAGHLLSQPHSLQSTAPLVAGSSIVLPSILNATRPVPMNPPTGIRVRVQHNRPKHTPQHVGSAACMRSGMQSLCRIALPTTHAARYGEFNFNASCRVLWAASGLHATLTAPAGHRQATREVDMTPGPSVFASTHSHSHQHTEAYVSVMLSMPRTTPKQSHCVGSHDALRRTRANKTQSCRSLWGFSTTGAPAWKAPDMHQHRSCHKESLLLLAHCPNYHSYRMTCCSPHAVTKHKKPTPVSAQHTCVPNCQHGITRPCF